MRTALTLCILLFSAFGGHSASFAQPAPVSAASQECLDCHVSLHPGIVETWKNSRHAAATPEQGLSVQGPARRVNGSSIPEEMRKTSVGCAECHTLGSHEDAFDHNGRSIHIVVSSRDCSTCHAEEATQFDKNLMAHAHENLSSNNVFQLLAQSINAVPGREDAPHTQPAPSLTDADSCL